jgi:5-methylcytosine-specific restriction enzyme B
MYSRKSFRSLMRSQSRGDSGRSLLAGDKVLTAFDVTDMSDEAYSRLQTAMEKASPDLSKDGWAHKYRFLLHNDRLDDYHSPRYQRFHLIKLLQLPPDHLGILSWQAPRFICAGRFISAARELEVPVITTLDTVLNKRNGSFHRYWRIGHAIMEHLPANAVGELQARAGAYPPAVA